MKKVVLFSSIFMMAGAMGAWAAACAETGTFGALSIETVDGKCVATFDSVSTETLSIPQDFSVDTVVFSRTFKAQQYQTVVLPISFSNGGYLNGADVCSLTNMVHYSEHEPWQIVCERLEPDSIKQNTPYIIQAHGTPKFIAKEGGHVVIHATSSNDNLINAFAENWEFRGTYTYKKWEEGDSQIGHVYGFAANDKEVEQSDGTTKTIKAGKFVKVKAGAFIKPMRAYLYYNKQALARRGALAKATDDEDLPSSIEVIFKDKNGAIASIGRMDPVTGTVTPVEGWYDMKGRKLNKKPTLPGTYFNNGEKVIIK